MVQNKTTSSAGAAVFRNAMIGLSAAGTLLILVWVLKYSAYGIDFTDEGFYLNWVSNPFIYDGSTTQFGFVYHPLHAFLGGDIAALRRANVLLTFVLAWGLVYVLFKSFALQSEESRIALPAAAAGLATSAFTIFDSWLITPSYNSLALQALLLACTGLFWASKKTTLASLSGWLMVAVGGWLAFMAKPSTALALAVGFFMYLLFSRKFTIRLALLAALVAAFLLFMSALLIDGSVWGFVQRLRLGIEFNQLLGGGHSLMQILRIDDFQLGENAKQAIVFVGIASFLATGGVIAGNRIGLIISLFVSLAAFIYVASLIGGGIHQVENLGRFQGLLILGVVGAAILSGLALGRVEGIKNITPEQWALIALFFVMPHIYAFGTNSNYWQGGSWAGIFWLLGGVGMLMLMGRNRLNWTFLLPLALVVQAVVVTLLMAGWERPYRQPEPLGTNQTVLKVGRHQSKLVLSAEYAAYIESAATVAKAAGFEPEMPVIDLSGQSPGILYVMGAESIGQAWIIGGYSGSLERAAAALGRVDCEKIASAWVLFEPNGPRSISADLLSLQGISFPGDYRLAGSWISASGAGGYAERRKQYLYAPSTQQENIRSCRAARGQ
ncbi:membrane protein [Achromobacter spanius]|uniref:Membrane protein n=2 Tax=Achromobacter spanius TaxID=217203 RepID=A0AAW3I6U9_9BURK|nr:membrane protein [Achromobacter spanius]